MRRLLLIILVFVFAGCEKENPKQAAPVAPAKDKTIGLTDVSNWSQAKRLAPDDRFVRAFADIKNLASEGGAEAKAEYSGSWKILVDGDEVATFGELPKFTEMTKALEAYAKKTVKPAPAATPPAEAVESIDMFLSPGVIKGLRLMNEVEQPGPEMLELAARAYVYLVVQMDDHLAQGDAVAARALAALALAKSAGKDMTAEEALLAYELGYANHAFARAQKLDQDEPIRRFLLEWTRGEKAEELSSSLVERSLYLWAIKKGPYDAKDWWTAVKTHFGGAAPTAAAVASGVHLAKFKSEKKWEGAIIQMLEQEIESGKPKGQNLNVLPFDGPQPYTQSSETALGSVKPAFDSDVEELIAEKAGEAAGPWLDADIYEGFYRSQTMDRAYRLANVHAKKLGSHRSLAGFLGEISADDSPRASQFKRYFSLHQASLEGGASEAEALLVLQEVKDLGAEPRIEAYRVLAGATGWNSPTRIKAFLDVADPLDSRPETQAEFGHVLTFYAWDLPGGASIAKSLRETNDRIGNGLVFRLARLRSEPEVLEAAIGDSDATLATRLIALEEFAKMPEIESERVEAAFEKLLGEYESNWSIASDYANFLEKEDRPKASVEFLESWIKEHGSELGFRPIYEATAFSDALRKAGKTKRAVEVIEPHLSSWQAGALTRAALAYEANGEPVRAHKLLVDASQRYPRSQIIRSHLVRIPWQEGEYAGAAERLAKSKVKPDWNLFGDAFIETFDEKPEEAQKAIAAMVKGGVSRDHVASLGRYLFEKGRPLLAFEATKQTIPSRGQQKMALELRAYKYLAAAKSDEAAKEWLATRLPKGRGGPVPMMMYGATTYDLIWTWASEPKEPFNWLMRAAAWLASDSRDADRKATLDAHYGSPKDEKYHTFGRVLLGMADAEAGWKFVKSKRDKAEYTFFLGLRALEDDQHEEASNLMHETVLTGETRTGEYHWAVSYLQGWSDTGKPEMKP